MCFIFITSFNFEQILHSRRICWYPSLPIEEVELEKLGHPDYLTTEDLRFKFMLCYTRAFALKLLHYITDM